jgi:hypothetical protein
MCRSCYHFMLSVPKKNPSHPDKSVPCVFVNHFASPKALHDLFSLFFDFLSHTELSSHSFVLLVWSLSCYCEELGSLWLCSCFFFFVHLFCYYGEPSCSWLSLSWLPCCFSFLLFLSCCHGESLAHDNFDILFFLSLSCLLSCCQELGSSLWVPILSFFLLLSCCIVSFSFSFSFHYIIVARSSTPLLWL